MNSLVSKKTVLFLMGFSALYIILTTIWWTVALVNYGKEHRQLQLKQLHSDSIHAAGNAANYCIKMAKTMPIENGVELKRGNQKLYLDTSVLFPMLRNTYPSFKYAIITGAQLSKAISITQNGNIAYKIERKYKTKRASWIGEGITSGIFLLIIFGFLYFYMDKILSLNQQQNNFLLATTHELRTPVAASKLAIETVIRQAKPELKPMLDMALSNMDRLAHLMDRVLLATRLESGTMDTLHKQPVELNLLIKQTIDELRPSFSNSVEIDLDLSPNLSIIADVELMSLAISNLITNAVKYGPSGNEKIRITSFVNKNRVAMSIGDNGPGIPENERKKIFQKFYRIGDENTRTSKGSGLGLYLVKKILRQHNAIILVESIQPKGSLFKIVFRKAVVEP